MTGPEHIQKLAHGPRGISHNPLHLPTRHIAIQRKATLRLQKITRVHSHMSNKVYRLLRGSHDRPGIYLEACPRRRGHLPQPPKVAYSVYCQFAIQREATLRKLELSYSMCKATTTWRPSLPFICIQRHALQSLCSLHLVERSGPCYMTFKNGQATQIGQHRNLKPCKMEVGGDINLHSHLNRPQQRIALEKRACPRPILNHSQYTMKI